jgi:lysophospholipase L1-like esterase
VEEIMEKYVILIQKIEEQSPATKIYIQNILPTNVRLYGTKHKINDIILEVNKLLESYCKQAHITYIDLYSNFNDNGKLKLKYDCGDHLHLSGYGYIEWCRIIQEYVYE